MYRTVTVQIELVLDEKFAYYDDMGKQNSQLSQADDSAAQNRLLACSRKWIDRLVQ